LKKGGGKRGVDMERGGRELVTMEERCVLDDMIYQIYIIHSRDR
jgi:hypothetical protein